MACGFEPPHLPFETFVLVLVVGLLVSLGQQQEAPTTLVPGEEEEGEAAWY